MKKIAFIHLVLSLSVLFSCGVKKNATSTSSSGVSKLDYAYIDKFHEGLRYKQRGEVALAILSFEQCLSMKQTDDAVYFALSQLHETAGNQLLALKSLEQASALDPSNQLYLQAYTYLNFEAGKFEDAIMGFEKLIKIDGANIEWLYGYAETLMKAGRYKKAIEALEETEKFVGNQPELVLQKFNLYIEMNKSSKGIDLMNEAIKEFPEEPLLIGTLVDYYFRIRENDKAIEMLELLVQSDPNNGRAHIGLADIYRQLGKKEAYFEELKKGFQCVDTDIDVKMKMLIDIQDANLPITPQIMELVDLLVLQYPTDAKSHSIKGDFLLKLEKEEEALTEYKIALEYDKSRFPIWNQVLLMQYQKRDYQALYEDSKSCIALFPSQPSIFLLNGISANQLKKHDEAIQTLEVGKELVINDKLMQSEFYGQLGEAYFGLEQFIEGKTNYELALNFNQNSTLNLNNFAYRLAMANIDLERAEELIKRVNTISPNQPHFLDTYGWILFQQKKYEEAKQFFEKAYDRNSKDAVIVEHVGDINYKLGLIDQALIFWLKAKELGSTNRVLNDKIENKTYYDPKY